MPVKLRLTRRGRKKSPYYQIVVADARAPRDGKYIETIGSYDPKTNPATIELDTDKALSWLSKGAQPTETTRAILRYKGVMYKKHLQKGVTKELFSQEIADEKFNEWVERNNRKVRDKIENLIKDKNASKAERLAAEKKINELIAKKVADKRIAAMPAAPEPEVVEETVAEAAEGTPDSTNATAAATASENVSKTEATPEPVAAEKVETPVQEVPPQAVEAAPTEAPAPTAEAKSEEAPAVAETPEGKKPEAVPQDTAPTEETKKEE